MTLCQSLFRVLQQLCNVKFALHQKFVGVISWHNAGETVPFQAARVPLHHFPRVTCLFICQMFALSVTRSNVVQQRFFQTTSCWLVQSWVSKQTRSAKWTRRIWALQVQPSAGRFAFSLLSCTRSFSGIVSQKIQPLILTRCEVLEVSWSSGPCRHLTALIHSLPQAAQLWFQVGLKLSPCHLAADPEACPGSPGLSSLLVGNPCGITAGTEETHVKCLLKVGFYIWTDAVFFSVGGKNGHCRITLERALKVLVL